MARDTPPTAYAKDDFLLFHSTIVVLHGQREGWRLRDKAQLASSAAEVGGGNLAVTFVQSLVLGQFLIFYDVAQLSNLDCAYVDVLAAIIGLDEARALLGVEPSCRSGRHQCRSFKLIVADALGAHRLDRSQSKENSSAGALWSAMAASSA